MAKFELKVVGEFVSDDPQGTFVKLAHHFLELAFGEEPKVKGDDKLEVNLDRKDGDIPEFADDDLKQTFGPGEI